MPAVGAPEGTAAHSGDIPNGPSRLLRSLPRERAETIPVYAEHTLKDREKPSLADRTWSWCRGGCEARPQGPAGTSLQIALARPRRQQVPREGTSRDACELRQQDWMCFRKLTLWY